MSPECIISPDITRRTLQQPNQKSIKIETSVNGTGHYAKCEPWDNAGPYGRPYCENHNDPDDPIYCVGACRINDWYNVNGNVSFCCEFSNGLADQVHCCDYTDACHDNWEQTDDCANW